MATCIIDGKITHKPTYDTPTLTEVQELIPVPEHVSGYFLYPDTDKSSTGFYVICPQEATNLVKNPTFFNNLDSWSSLNSTMVRTNRFAFDSGFSVRIGGSGDLVTAERREYIESEIEGFIPGQLYTLSGYLWTPSIWDLSDTIAMTLSIAYSNDDGVTIVDEVFSEQITKTRLWQRPEVTYLVPADATNVYVRINLRSQDARINNPPFGLTGDFNLESEYIFADMIQFEQGQQATTPFHGDTSVCKTSIDCNSNYTWLESSHNGPSHRSECARDGGVLCSLSSLGLEISSHIGDGEPQLTDISTPYANRPGEFCEAISVGPRIITLTGILCGDIDCTLTNLGKIMYPNSGGECCGEFLLVFRHEDCIDLCEPNRDLALCVSYLGGLGGVRDSIYQRQVTIQLKAFDPFWFEFPGHSSTGLPLGQGVVSQSAAQIHSDGTMTGFSLPAGSSVSEIACAGNGAMVFGGSFPDGSSLAVLDCEEFCETYGLFNGITVNDLVTTSGGDVAIATSFGLSIYYQALNTFGTFPGYAGGAANAVAAPFWADIAVAGDDGVFIQLRDGTWLSYTTDAPVNDIVVDQNGNIIVVGEFSTINGVTANKSAILNVNSTGCLDIDNAFWTSYPTDAGFDDFELRTVAHDLSTGISYVGGAVDFSTPYPQDTCIITQGNSSDSKGSAQEIQITDNGGDQYTVIYRFTNVVSMAFAEYCINSADARRFIRITGTSTLGTLYTFLFGDTNITSTTIAVAAVNDLWDLTLTLDLTQDLGDPCDTLNPSFVEEFDISRRDVRSFAVLTMPAGLGYDNTISSWTVQCVQLEDTFQGDSTQINQVAQISGNSVQAMDLGLPNSVNKLFVHPETGQVYALLGFVSDTYPAGVALWNGNSWTEPALLTGGTQILDIAWCPFTCSLLVAYGAGTSLASPSSQSFNYCGTADLYNPTLILHGPALLNHFNVNNRVLNACTRLMCNEVGIFDFGSSSYMTTEGRDLNQSILAGSRKDLTFNASCSNVLSLLVDPESQEAETTATVIWRNLHYDSAATCCACIDQYDEFTIDSTLLCCSASELIQLRDPTVDDCADTGTSQGDLWVNALCLAFFVNGSNDCEDCDNVGFVDTLGGALELDDEVICPITSP